jgi:predicted SnoaL-like aldol condensation-catalyzing enzyme
METNTDTITNTNTNTSADALTDNKQLILDCLARYGEGDHLDAVAPLLRDDYTDHGLPFQTSTKAAWIAVARELPLADMRIDIRRLMSEGDYVMMYSRRSLPDGALDIAVADVFRVEDGLIAERWEIVEPIPRDAPDPVATL